MIDYDNIQVTRNRFKDKASGSNIRWIDRVWTRWMLRDRKKIACGRNVVVKPSVDLRICETGRLKIGSHCRIDDDCMLLLTMPHPAVDIGDWVKINRNTVIAAKNRVHIGSYTLIAPYCYLVDHEHGSAPGDLIQNQRSILKSIHIGKDCWLGTGVKILGGVHVGDGAIIGAGSVVTTDIPGNQVWAGMPAKFIKFR